MALRLNNILLLTFLMFGSYCFSQEDPKPPRVDNYKTDSSYAHFEKLRSPVARAQIKLLKDSGALLVRLKTNALTIARLKAAGSMDMATQVERETRMTNKLIVRAYTDKFYFCPVYFFTSDVSDSVKHKNLTGIFVDTNLVVDPTIVCNATFYLIAEQGSIYDSSLGLVPLSQAPKAIERGTSTKEVSILIKNRYFIQLHKPFPYYQQGYSIKRYGDAVRRFNSGLVDFYKKNSTYTISPEIRKYIY